jgi:hypothetical protein
MPEVILHSQIEQWVLNFCVFSNNAAHIDLNLRELLTSYVDLNLPTDKDGGPRVPSR